jgi:hypothetical protein
MMLEGSDALTHDGLHRHPRTLQAHIACPTPPPTRAAPAPVNCRASRPGRRPPCLTEGVPPACPFPGS